MQPVKRKLPPEWARTASPAPSGVAKLGTPGGRSGTVPVSVSVKPEPGTERKPERSAPPNMSSGPDARTAALVILGLVKRAGTMSEHDAFFRIQEEYPTLDTQKVLDYVKSLDKIEVNAVNGALSFKRDLEITNTTQLRTYIRTNSRPLAPVSMRLLRDAAQPSNFSLVAPLGEMESRGELLIMRSLAGQEFKDVPLPALGKPNVFGLKITEGRQDRWKSVWWDELRERGRAGQRVPDEIVEGWDQVKIGEKDDVAVLLQEQDLSGVAKEVPKEVVKLGKNGPDKKKRKTTRALKITNTHMMAQGIDFSKDYERPS